MKIYPFLDFSIAYCAFSNQLMFLPLPFIFVIFLGGSSETSLAILSPAQAVVFKTLCPCPVSNTLVGPPLGTVVLMHPLSHQACCLTEPLHFSLPLG